MRFSMVPRALVLLLSPALLALVLVVLSAPPSASGFAYALSLLALTVSAFVARARPRRLLVRGGLALLVAAVLFRLAFAGHGRDVQMKASGDGARWVDRVIDEEDLAVNGARALVWTGMMPDPDVPALAATMRRAYGRMRAEEGDTPSPVVATYLGLERPGADDTIEVGDVARSAGVVVFLHGYAGSFTLPCWVIARAARDAGFATVCPSTRWVGDWWSPGGEATLRAVVADLKRRGATRLVLAGLSNGGNGASVLLPRMRGVFAGLVLVSGVSPGAPAPQVPVLVLQGERDAQIPASVARAYARRVGARYLSLDAGHFALLAQEEPAAAAITSFLRTCAP